MKRRIAVNTEMAGKRTGRRVVVYLTAWVAVAALLGCGGTSGPELGKVKGTVTQKGKPLADVDVMFLPERGAPSSAKTDAAGNFELKFNDGRPGAVPGKHQVLITIPGTELPPPTGDEQMPEVVKPPVEFRKQVEVSASGENDLKIEVEE
ncbi:MAG: carboxypeptidase regulatory-like domain-containing protein [Candidatus Anammoximicrobium sp.]|nr:carboxypeptidase regulatory-like domain-containing protein [Candidatus Anammoximicrobium sp.]